MTQQYTGGNNVTISTPDDGSVPVVSQTEIEPIKTALSLMFALVTTTALTEPPPVSSNAERVSLRWIVSDGWMPVGVSGVIAGHQNRHLAIDPKTGALFVGVGSAGNIGVEPEVKASVQRFEADGSGQTTFASLMRNPTT